MKFIWHIVRKDFLHLRGWWVLWVVAVAAKYVAAIYLVRSANLELLTIGDWKQVMMWLSVADAVLAYFIAARVVQEDSVVEPNAFWMTRPISRGRLLVAKLAGLAVMLGVSSLALAVPWWVTCGYELGQMVRAATEVLLLQIAVIAPAAMIAAVTDSFPRFLLWTMVLVVAGAAAAALGSLYAGMMRLGVVLGTGIIVVTAIVVLVQQYFTRRLVLSVVWAGMGVGAAMLMAISWWGSVLQPDFRRDQTEKNADRAKDVRLELFRSTVRERPPDGGQPAFSDVHLDFAVYGVPEGLAIAGGPMNHTWHWLEGGQFSTTRTLDTGPFHSEAVRRLLGMPASDWEPEKDPETKEWFEAQRAARGWPERKIESWPPNAEIVTSRVRMQPSLGKRLVQQPSRYEGTTTGALWRPEVLLEIPFGRSSWRARSGFGMRIDAMRVVDQRVLPRRREYWNIWAQGSAVFVEQESWVTSRLFSTSRARSVDFGVIDRASGWLGWDHAWRDASRSAIEVAGVRIEIRPVSTGAQRVIRNGQWVLKREDWLEHGRLVVVRFHEDARFRREVMVERFEVTREGAGN